jgi:glucose-6-phosphate isomerase
MQLPDEAISYDYRGLLLPPGEEWSPAAELRARYFLSPAKLRDLGSRLTLIRSQIAAERELQQVPAEIQPLDAGFIDLPQKSLDQYRRQKEVSDLGRVRFASNYLREQVDRVVLLGAGGSCLGAQALFEALRGRYHNELPPDARLGSPRLYFQGNSFDNDALQELMELLQVVCVDPERREERWGVVVTDKAGETLETAAAYRLFRQEAAQYYGTRSERLLRLVVPATGAAGKFRQLCKAQGFRDEDILTLPDHVGDRYSVFTAAGLLPAAIVGLDVRALLLGAAAMTRRFLDEPFERNPVLQYAAVNYLMSEEMDKPVRVLQIWSEKLEGLGLWYDHLVAESLGKNSRGPTPLTMVATRDLHARGQQHQEGARDKIIQNLVVRTPRSVPLPIGMADHNEDELNALARKTLPDLADAALRGMNHAYAAVARPTADLILPTLSEHTMGQLMQMLMLATVVEGRLMGVNPYGQPGVEAYRRNMRTLLE